MARDKKASCRNTTDSSTAGAENIFDATVFFASSVVESSWLGLR